MSVPKERGNHMHIKEDTIKATVTVILLGLALLTALILETRMVSWVPLQIILLVFAAGLASLILFGLWLEEEWAYTFATLFFAGALADLLFVFAVTRELLPFSFGVLVAVCGIVISLISTSEKPIVHTYDLKPVEEVRREIDENIAAARRAPKTSKKTTKRAKKKKR